MKTYTFRSWSHANEFIAKLDSCCDSRDDYYCEAKSGTANYPQVNTNASDEDITSALELIAGVVKVQWAK